ncbi:hypothetical protein DICVIV_02436 [Dictyocaulus viviparus]|uniref:Uncharacterized protein n=1 Tax=Dictyocaulus viviparus TaxID=29172 RepID=A0A0D8Y5F7_DICVI|nr:hypothetical protein DICVIV_02436 [Dictyocaulus viviparus]
MNEESYATGVRNDDEQTRRQYAALSKEWNLACPEFKEMFPSLFDELKNETMGNLNTSK